MKSYILRSDPSVTMRESRSSYDVDAIQKAFEDKIAAGRFDTDSGLRKAFVIDRIISLLPQGSQPGESEDEGGSKPGEGEKEGGSKPGESEKEGKSKPGEGEKEGKSKPGEGEKQGESEPGESEKEGGSKSGEGEPKPVDKLDREACDKGVPPSMPSQELLDELSQLNRVLFQTAISSAQLEFIAVYEGDKMSEANADEKPLYVGYARRDKGSVAIPTTLLEDESKSYCVIHNHPNSASFSPADFTAFCDYKSIARLLAVTVPFTYVFKRKELGYKIPDSIESSILNHLDVQVETSIRGLLLAETYPEMNEAEEKGSINEFFACTNLGARIWSRTTSAAWYSAFEAYADSSKFDYDVWTNDKDAEGEFGTADVDDVLILTKKLAARYAAARGVGEVSRHKAPYADTESYYSPAYDVSKAFPEIYSLPFAKALNAYGDGSDADAEALQIIRNLHNQPDAKIKIYRAVEKGLRDRLSDLRKDRTYLRQNSSTPPWADVPVNTTDEYSEFVESQIDNLGAVDGATIQPSIGVRDWVTITKRYAEDHGDLAIPGGYSIISKTVRAKDLFTDGNSIHEWGYDPEADEESLGGLSFDPPESVRSEAKRGLEWRREFNRGGTEVGVARARDLSNGRSVSLDTMKRIKAYFDRHQVDKNAEGFRLGEEGYPSAGRIAWALWGGDAGYTWAKNIVAKHSDGLNDTLAPEAAPPTTEAAPLTTREIVSMEPPEALPLTGELREFLTNLLAKFNMLIWGGAGSGKSSFVLRLANELAETNTGRVLYYMTEEKVASGRLKARMDLMKAYSENINFDDQGTFDRLTALVNTGMYRYVIVDSINMINVEQTKIVELMQTFPEVSWIFIAQATKGKNAYAGIQSLAHAVDTEIATTNDKGTGIAELKKHRDGPLKTHTIFGNAGMRDPAWKKSW